MLFSFGYILTILMPFMLIFGSRPIKKFNKPVDMSSELTEIQNVNVVSSTEKIDSFLEEIKDRKDENCKVVEDFKLTGVEGNFPPLVVGYGKNLRFIPIVLREGNIVEQADVDTIVNAANDCLQHAVGVAKAIDDAAGFDIQNAYLEFPSRDQWNTKLSVGGAVITPAFNLEKIGIKKIIHAVGPCAGDSDRLQKLHDAYENSMKIAKKNKLRSIMFPPISTGLFGCPIKECTPVAIKSVLSFLQNYPDSFDKVVFIIYPSDEKIEDYRCAYRNNLKELIDEYNANKIAKDKKFSKLIPKINPAKSLPLHHE